MQRTELDHIVIGAASLGEGVRFIRERLGVDIPAGGKHPLMSTHNHLMRVGDGAFLEIISIDPEAPPPGRVRWFDLDQPAMRARLAESPRVITWVVRSSDIVATTAAATYPLGAVEAVQRDTLSWRLTLPEDGGIRGDGVLPHAIEWDNGARPWERMADLGCRLEGLVICHPDAERIEADLRSIGADGIAGLTVKAGSVPGLSVRIRTLSGEVVTL